MVERARALNQVGRNQAALDLLGPALAHDPEDPALMLQAAVALIDLDRAADAVPYLRSAAAAAPGVAGVHLLMSMALRGVGDLPGAYRAAVRATELAPHEAQAHVQVALSALALRDPHNGRQAAEYAIRLDPNDPVAHLALSAILFPEATRPPKAQLQEAEDHLRRALELRPGDPAALNELARIQMARGRLTAAAGHLSSSVRGAPAEELMHRNMDSVLVALVGRFHWLLFIVWFIGGSIVGGTGEQASRWMFVLLGVIGVAALGAIGWQLRTKVPADMRVGLLRGFVRRQRLGAAWAVCLLLTSLLFLAAALVPTPIATGLFFVGGIPLVAGAVLSWIRFFRDRRT